MKTIERAHTPALMWERVLLSRNYAQAIATIDENLQYWPKFLLLKCKQRLTRMHQYLMRMRKLKLKAQPKLVRIHKKSERRDLIREKKAEKAAKISNAIQKELLSRLNDPEVSKIICSQVCLPHFFSCKVDVYDGIYNFPRKEFKKIVQTEAEENELEEDDIEMDEDELEMDEMEEEEEDDENVGKKEMLVDEFVEAESDEDVEEIGGVMRGRFGADDDDEEGEDNAELQELLRTLRKRKTASPAPPGGGEGKKKRRARVEIETEGEGGSLQHNSNN